MMRIHAIILAALLCASPQSLEAQKRVTLRLVDWASLDEITVDTQAIAAFQARMPGIDVLYEPNPGRQYEEKLLTAMAADDPPDVFLLDSKLIPTFTNKGVLLDLEPFIRPLGIDTAQWFPGALAIARKGSRLYAFPKGFTPLMMYYNRALFREAGIPYPAPNWTWEDYLGIARRLTRRSADGKSIVQYGTAFTNYYFSWIPWIWSAGGDVVDSTGSTASGTLNSPPTEEALRFLIGLRNDAHVAPDAGTWIQSEKTGTNSALFANGKIAMILDGHWRLPQYIKFSRQGLLDIGVAPLPFHPGGRKVNVMYESGWCVPVNCRHPREAVLLAAFMSGEIAGRIRSTGRLEIPSNIKVAGEAVAADSTGMEKIFVDEVPYCRQPWGARIERFSEIEWTLQDAVDEVMVNGKPLHQTLSSFAARVDEELSEIRKHATETFRPIRQHSEILWFLLAVTGCITLISAVAYFRTHERERRYVRTAAIFIGPSLLHLAVFVLTPIAFAAWLSVHRWDIVVPQKPFVGLGNFADMAHDPTFWNALRNTFVYSLNVPIGMAVALAVALILHRSTTGVGFLRTIYFLPSVTSFVAIALVWMWIYDPSFGAANFLLRSAGLPAVGWLNSSDTAMISVMIFSIWMGIGYQMVIFLAGLQGIPAELYDAARVDGAGGWRRFRHVTFPLLRPTTFFILVTSFISSFQVFTTIYVMTAGGPVRSTDVFVYHIYQAAWEQLRMGYAAAMSWVLFLIIMAATWLQFRFLGASADE